MGSYKDNFMYRGGGLILSRKQKAATSSNLIESIFDERYEGDGEGLDILVEAANGGKKPRTKVVGNCIECDVEGINKRIYRSTTMAREAKNFTNNYIKTGMAWGEMNHPILSKDGFGVIPPTDINMMKASHYIEEMWMFDRFLKMKAIIVEDMPAGAVAKAIVDNGFPIHVSIRGQGPTEKIGTKTYVSDLYRLITVDFVGRPSFGPAATMETIVESVLSHGIPLLTESVETAVSDFMTEVNCIYRQGNHKEMADITVAKLMDRIGGL